MPCLLRDRGVLMMEGKGCLGVGGWGGVGGDKQLMVISSPGKMSRNAVTVLERSVALNFVIALFVFNNN